MIARRLFLLGFAAALITGISCSSGSDDSGGGTTSPTIACTDGGAPGANVVAMTCGGAASGTTEHVAVVIGGPASGTTTLRGLNFDVTYDPAELAFVAPVSFSSPLFPDALIAVTLANGLPGRLVVSVQQPGSALNVSVPAGHFTVLTLSFSHPSGTTLAPSPLAFENFEATGASAAVTFTSSLALSYP